MNVSVAVLFKSGCFVCATVLGVGTRGCCSWPNVLSHARSLPVGFFLFRRREKLCRAVTCSPRARFDAFLLPRRVLCGWYIFLSDLPQSCALQGIFTSK